MGPSSRPIFCRLAEKYSAVSRNARDLLAGAHQQAHRYRADIGQGMPRSHGISVRCAVAHVIQKLHRLDTLDNILSALTLGTYR